VETILKVLPELFRGGTDPSLQHRFYVNSGSVSMPRSSSLKTRTYEMTLDLSPIVIYTCRLVKYFREAGTN
jgi:hypothetical protein